MLILCDSKNSFKLGMVSTRLKDFTDIWWSNVNKRSFHCCKLYGIDSIKWMVGSMYPVSYTMNGWTSVLIVVKVIIFQLSYFQYCSMGMRSGEFDDQGNTVKWNSFYPAHCNVMWCWSAVCDMQEIILYEWQSPIFPSRTLPHCLIFTVHLGGGASTLLLLLLL